MLPSKLHKQSGTSTFMSAGNPRSSSNSRRSARFDADGTFTMTSLLPDRALEVTVLDMGGQTLVEASTTTPAFGRAVTVDLVPAVPICRIEGRVLSAVGEPAAAAHVWIGEERQVGNSIFQARSRTDAEGRVAMRLCATGEMVPVRIEAAGHCVYRGSLRLIEGVVEPVFVLERGYDITARVVDESGAAVDAAVAVLDTDLAAQVSRREDGATSIRRLPGRSVELTASYGGRTFSKSVLPQAQQGDVTIQVPTPLTIPLRVATYVPPSTVLTLSVRATAGDGRIYLQVHCVDGKWQPSTLQIYPGEYDVQCEEYAGSESWTTKWSVKAGDDSVRWLMQ